MTKDDAYRDPLDRADDLATGVAPSDEQVATDVASLESAVRVAGTALIEALDAIVSSVYPDPLDTADLLARITDAVTIRRDTYLTRLVTDRKMNTRDIAKRLGWTPARVAFSCRAPSQR